MVRVCWKASFRYIFFSSYREHCGDCCPNTSIFFWLWFWGVRSITEVYNKVQILLITPHGYIQYTVRGASLPIWLTVNWLFFLLCHAISNVVSREWCRWLMHWLPDHWDHRTRCVVFEEISEYPSRSTVDPLRALVSWLERKSFVESIVLRVYACAQGELSSWWLELLYHYSDRYTYTSKLRFLLHLRGLGQPEIRTSITKVCACHNRWIDRQHAYFDIP